MPADQWVKDILRALSDPFCVECPKGSAPSPHTFQGDALRRDHFGPHRQSIFIFSWHAIIYASALCSLRITSWNISIGQLSIGSVCLCVLFRAHLFQLLGWCLDRILQWRERGSPLLSDIRTRETSPDLSLTGVRLVGSHDRPNVSRRLYIASRPSVLLVPG